ncbi:MAG: lipid-A-disaccharide synthase [Candidatus Ancaeobacter aquaticus]|nr:lipid-A-disaccharide synthase [Candidatus Ancaeobacter aquaticus]
MKKILVIAGEQSGDMHGAHLVREICAKKNDVRVFAAGGEKLKAAGATLLYDLASKAVMGSVEVLKHYRELKRVFNSLLLFVDTEKPDVVILIDYPGFNLKFAEAVKKKGVKVIYYISPQIWAWAPGRITKIKRCVDHMIVILPFEKDLYEKAGVPVTYVGHPLIDSMKEGLEESFVKEHSIKSDDCIVGILPGSRETEIKKNLPIMLETAELLQKTNVNTRFFIAYDQKALGHIVPDIMCKHTVHVEIVDNVCNVMKVSKVCMVASGTATIQTAFYLTPMVIIYKVAVITWFLAKLLIKIPYIGLVNVIAQKKIIDEYIQFDAKPELISSKVKDIIDDCNKYAQIKEELGKVKEKLGRPGASARAADVVLTMLG